MSKDIDAAAILDSISTIALKAGEAIMAVYATDFEARTKDDDSPVTDADLAAEEIITPALRALLPDVPVVAEEAAAAGHAPDVSGGRFWLVDPLDGTKEFLNRNGEFTVNIALIESGLPRLGVVYAPAIETMYAGSTDAGATRTVGDAAPQPISVRDIPDEGLTIVASRRHGDPELLEAFLGGRPVRETRNAGSSLKFCLVAAGEADLYPRFGRTMEWDTAAGHAVLAAAGGRVLTAENEPFTYAKNAIFENPHFVAWGGR
ncbi:MAG: 3'(2'),5'-bisphosphate nucleotidase CysQ [Alphaproteobacteria bacterium]